jgi:Cysteine-rich CWC
MSDDVSMGDKRCPRCEQPFVCQADNVSVCQCRVIDLSAAEKAWIKAHYADCLCVVCLHTLKDELKQLSLLGKVVKG